MVLLSYYSNILFGLKRQLLWLTDGHFSSDEILRFLENNKFPLVTIMTELNSAKVYSGTNKLQVALPSLADYFCFFPVYKKSVSSSLKLKKGLKCMSKRLKVYFLISLVCSNQVYVFAEDDDLQKFLKPLQEIAKKFKSQVFYSQSFLLPSHFSEMFL